MPYINILIHLVWATKRREATITAQLKPVLLKHIRENAKKKDIYILAINCVADHIHILVSLGKEQKIAEIARLIKGESSFWVNKNQLINGKFEWQDDYFALSVDKFGLKRVIGYIENQEQHHQKRTFKVDYEKFLEEEGIELPLLTSD